MSQSSRAALEIAEALALAGACACCGDNDTCSGCDCCRLHCGCDFNNKDTTDEPIQD
jgi:hypothetical protein